MATHTGIPTWKIPWTEEPGGLQSTTDHTCTCTHTHQLSHGLWKNSPFSDCFKMVLLLPLPFDLQWLCFWVGHFTTVAIIYCSTNTPSLQLWFPYDLASDQAGPCPSSLLFFKFLLAILPVYYQVHFRIKIQEQLP